MVNRRRDISRDKYYFSTPIEEQLDLIERRDPEFKTGMLFYLTAVVRPERGTFIDSVHNLVGQYIRIQN